MAIITTGNFASGYRQFETRPMDVSIPVPNTREGEKWWMAQAHRDIDNAINMAVAMEQFGFKWAEKALRLIMKAEKD